MFKTVVCTVVPLVVLCGLCLVIVFRTVDDYIVHPTGTMGQPLRQVIPVAAGIVVAGPHDNRVCICTQELNLIPEDAEGITKGAQLIVTQGKKTQKVIVEDLGTRTFFHRVEKPENGEYRIPDPEPRVFVRIDKPLMGFDHIAKITVVKGVKISQRKK